MPGPFFRRLGQRLRLNGARVSRVNFNGGDVLDWWGAGTRAYRGTIEDWPRWLSDFARSEGVTDIIVFGDRRQLHRPAHLLADRQGLRFFAFEEGYLRPDHVTLERGGVNGISTFPKSLRALELLADRLAPGMPDIRLQSRFGARAWQAAYYGAATMFATALFPRYRSHRLWSPWREAIGWAGRLLGKRAEIAASTRDMEKLAARPFFLFPLQLEGDSQLRYYSSFMSMRDALEDVILSFATAPSEVMLVIKMHPLDPGIVPWRRVATDLAAGAGIPDRVVFVERHDLAPLLRGARGVVTVNSTVGPLALAEGTPVLALGEAIYRVPGLSAGCTLEEFWQDPPGVDAANFDLFSRVLRAKCLVNGGFHSEEGLRCLIERSADRLMRP